MGGKKKNDLREILTDAHAHFFFLKGDGAIRVRLWQILSDGVVIDTPLGAAMRRTVLGYIPTIDGAGVYEIDGRINPEKAPEQMEGTIRVDIDASRVRRVNRRLFPRVSFTPPLAAAATPEGDRKAFPIRIVNFSAGGLRIESERKLAPEKAHTFRFRIDLDDEVYDLELKGRVVYEVPNKDIHTYGVKFLEVTGEKPSEASVATIDQTVDLLGLVNKLLVRE